MCGVAGCLTPTAIEPDRVATCLARMRRRGPDHAGARQWVTPDGRHMTLLHSRLSIIDLDERSHQPLGWDGRWLSFNGELYNYLELREEAVRRGARFSTQSDTQVLHWVLSTDGPQGLDRCEGMWAFAFYDERTGELLLGRDRFGEKPLYVFESPEGLYFGSEIQFLEALVGRPSTVDTSHVLRYLVNGYKALYKNGHGFHQGVREVKPAHVLRVDPLGRRSVERYWSPAVQAAEKATFEEVVQGARERLVRSVELRLRSDVPAAFCLSGGIDSSALVAIAKRVLGYDVHGFTILSGDPRYDERDMVGRVVEALGIRHTSVTVPTDCAVERLRNLVRYRRAPISTLTYYVHNFLIERMAQQGYRIAFSGTAADELFTGYYDHHLAYFHEIRDDGARLEEAIRAWRVRVRPYVRNPFLQDPRLFIHNPAFRDHIFPRESEFMSYLTRDWQEPFEESRYVDGLLRNRMMNELFHEVVPVILHEDDLNAMYFSVENRSPYLDRDLYEFSRAIPTSLLIRDGYAKAVLREAVRGWVPDAVLDNPRKVGFNVPIHEVVDFADRQTRACLLDPGSLFDLVRKDRVESLVSRGAWSEGESKFLFSLMNARLFLEEARA